MTLETEMQEELADAEHEAKRGAIRTKYAAKAAAKHISRQYRCSAEVEHKLSAFSCPTGEFALLITPEYQDATDEYVARFDRITFDSPLGVCTLQLEYHAAFGVCHFSYHQHEDE